MTLLDLWPRDEWDVHREVAKTVGDTYQSDRTWRHIKADGSEIEVLTYARRVPFGDEASRFWSRSSTSPSASRPKRASPIWRITMR